MSDENQSVSPDMLVARLMNADQSVKAALETRDAAFSHLNDLLSVKSSVLTATILSNLDFLAKNNPIDVQNWTNTLPRDAVKVGLSKVVVSGSEPIKTWDQARALFGHMVDMTVESDPRDVLTQCIEDQNTAGVVGWITSAGSGQWWPMMNESKFHDLRITGAWPVSKDEPPLAAIIAKGPIDIQLGHSTLLIAHDDHHRVGRAFGEMDLPVHELSRARSLVLFQIPHRIEESDPRLQAAKVSGLDGLRVVGALPNQNIG